MINMSLYQLSLWLGIGLVLVYTLGQHWRTAYREIMQSVGLIGTGLIIVWWFFSACPAIATGLVLRLLLTAVFIKLFFWLFFKYYYKNNPDRSEIEHPSDVFEPDSSESQDLYEKAIQAARAKHSNHRPAGFEQTDQERKTSREISSGHPK